MKYGLPLLRRGAAAIIFIADDVAEKAWDDAAENFKRGIYDIEGGASVNITNTVPVIWLHANAKKELQDNKGTIKANFIISKYPYPSVNIVGKITGTDAKLKSEYVLYSGHIDAHGIRNVINNDSVYYGADDNGSVDVAMLANARAFVKNPPKRSVLFVIHGAEERGLFGSKYFSSHPTVPVNDIVAVLNGDMIGRNNIDSAAILGVMPPHRNSLDLVNMALAANEEGPNFKIKRIEVEPGASLSLQMHHHRSEHWIVVSGMARVVNGQQELFVNINESTYIPAGNKHRLENPGLLPLVMIEVQSGEYLGEDDIVRFEDIYGRTEKKQD